MLDCRRLKRIFLETKSNNNGTKDMQKIEVKNMREVKMMNVYVAGKLRGRDVGWLILMILLIAI